jgi:hypothetical protein
LDNYLPEKTVWPEIKKVPDNGMRTGIIFAGSAEQHGPRVSHIQ